MLVDTSEATDDILFSLTHLTGKTEAELLEYAISRFATEYFSSEHPLRLIPHRLTLATGDVAYNV